MVGDRGYGAPVEQAAFVVPRAERLQAEIRQGVDVTLGEGPRVEAQGPPHGIMGSPQVGEPGGGGRVLGDGTERDAGLAQEGSIEGVVGGPDAGRA